MRYPGLNALLASEGPFMRKLRAYYAFEEASGTVINSKVGGFSGSVDSNTTRVAGISGNALNLPVGSSGNLDNLGLGSDDFSISMWIYFNTLPSAIYNFFTMTATGQPGLFFRTAGNNSFRVRASSGSTNVDMQSSSFQEEQWYHLGFTRKKAESGVISRIYFNGNASATNSNVIFNSDFGNDYGIAGSALNIRLDEMAFWKDRILSLEEFQELYNSGNGKFYNQF